MKLLASLLACFVLSSCSGSLNADVFNLSGRDLTICGGPENDRKCVPVASGAHAVLVFGVLQVTDRGSTFTYAFPPPEPFEKYQYKWKNGTTVVLDPNLRVLLARNDQEPTSVKDNEQPAGYPLQPRA